MTEKIPNRFGISQQESDARTKILEETAKPRENRPITYWYQQRQIPSEGQNLDALLDAVRQVDALRRPHP